LPCLKLANLSLRAVAINFVATFTPTPNSGDVETVLRILTIARVSYRRGERPAAVLARILTAIKIYSEGGELVPHRPVSEIEDRY
jgi:hypothetical protein